VLNKISFINLLIFWWHHCDIVLLLRYNSNGCVRVILSHKMTPLVL